MKARPKPMKVRPRKGRGAIALLRGSMPIGLKTRSTEPGDQQSAMPKAVTELRADFQHLRRWRKSVEQAQGFTFKAAISIIVAGFLGAVWLGLKAMLGK
jgi:hypothetical protein